MLEELNRSLKSLAEDSQAQVSGYLLLLLLSLLLLSFIYFSRF